jgi:hypothetical protein
VVSLYDFDFTSPYALSEEEKIKIIFLSIFFIASNKLIVPKILFVYVFSGLSRASKT